MDNRMPKNIIFAVLVLTITGTHAESMLKKSQKDEVAAVPAGDPEMTKAIKHAQSTLDDFLKKHQNPKKNQSNFSIKIGISDAGRTEYFWVSTFRRVTDSKYTGILDNEPRTVTNVEYGQQIEFNKSDIIDWTYVENKSMKGNFTACALIKREPIEQQRQFKKTYGLECKI